MRRSVERGRWTQYDQNTLVNAAAGAAGAAGAAAGAAGAAD